MSRQKRSMQVLGPKKKKGETAGMKGRKRRKRNQCVLEVGESGDMLVVGVTGERASCWPGWLEIPADGIDIALEKYPVLRAPRDVSASRASDRSRASRSFNPHFVHVALPSSSGARSDFEQHTCSKNGLAKAAPSDRKQEQSA